MLLTWVKPQNLKSGSMFLFNDGFVRMYLGVDGTTKNASMLFYSLCGVQTEEVSKTERNLMWGDMQREVIRSYMFKAISSEFKTSLVKKSRTLSMYPLPEFFVPDKVVEKWLLSNGVQNITASCTEGYCVNTLMSNVVRLSHVEVGKVYLYIKSYSNNEDDTGKYMPIVPVSIKREGYCGVSVILITDPQKFIENPEEYVVSAYKHGDVVFIRNKRILIPHGDYEFLADKCVSKGLIESLVEG